MAQTASKLFVWRAVEYLNFCPAAGSEFVSKLHPLSLVNVILYAWSQENNRIRFMATANWCSSDGFALAAHLTFSSQNKTPAFRHLQVYIKVSIFGPRRCKQYLQTAECCLEIHWPHAVSSAEVPLESPLTLQPHLHLPAADLRNLKAILLGQIYGHCPPIGMARASPPKEVGVTPICTGGCCPSLWTISFQFPLVHYFQISVLII